MLILNQQSENNQDLLIVNHPAIVQNTLENSSHKIVCKHWLFCCIQILIILYQIFFLLMSPILFSQTVCVPTEVMNDQSQSGSQRKCIFAPTTFSLGFFCWCLA